MRGLELAIAASDVVEAARPLGLLVERHREDGLRLLPPLTITEAEIDEAVTVLDAAMAACWRRVMIAASVAAPSNARRRLENDAPVIRPATPDDVAAIHALIATHQAAGRLLPRTEEEIARHADRFVVVDGRWRRRWLRGAGAAQRQRRRSAVAGRGRPACAASASAACSSTR